MPNWTEAEVASVVARQKPGAEVKPPAPTKRRSRGSHKTGVPNRTEQAYLDYLELRRIAGEIRAYFFEQVTLRLGPDVRYTPDVAVIAADGGLEFHEVKGARKGKVYATDDSLVKLRVAAGMFPWRFYLCHRGEGGEWICRVVGVRG